MVAKHTKVDDESVAARSGDRNVCSDNSTPMSGGYAGWICTVGGTPGTWHAFGALA
jgi:hypothetical protein